MQAAEVIARGEDPRPIEEALDQYVLTPVSETRWHPGPELRLIMSVSTWGCYVGYLSARNAASRPTRVASLGLLTRCASSTRSMMSWINA